MNIYFSKENKETGELTHFEELIKTSKKIHAILPGNKAAKGQPLKMYSGEKGSGSTIINDDREDLKSVVGAQSIVIKTKSSLYSGIEYSIIVDGTKLNETTSRLLSKNEGYTSLYEFLHQFIATPEWTGQIVHWTPLMY